jgi:hypothetical protein
MHQILGLLSFVFMPTIYNTRYSILCTAYTSSCLSRACGRPVSHCGPRQVFGTLFRATSDTDMEIVRGSPSPTSPAGWNVDWTELKQWVYRMCSTCLVYAAHSTFNLHTVMLILIHSSAMRCRTVCTYTDTVTVPVHRTCEDILTQTGMQWMLTTHRRVNTQFIHCRARAPSAERRTPPPNTERQSSTRDVLLLCAAECTAMSRRCDAVRRTVLHYHTLSSCITQGVLIQPRLFCIQCDSIQ